MFFLIYLRIIEGLFGLFENLLNYSSNIEDIELSEYEVFVEVFICKYINIRSGSEKIWMNKEGKC